MSERALRVPKSRIIEDQNETGEVPNGCDKNVAERKQLTRRNKNTALKAHPLTEEQRKEKLKKDSERKRLKRLNETEEERTQRLIKCAETKRRAIASETEEQRLHRLERNAEWVRKKRCRLKVQNEELFKQRSIYDRERNQLIRLNETEEKRIQRRKKAAEQKRKTIAKETEEKRLHRLKRNAAWAREKRNRMKQNEMTEKGRKNTERNKLRLLNETEEKRFNRLKRRRLKGEERMRRKDPEYARRRQRLETRTLQNCSKSLGNSEVSSLVGRGWKANDDSQHYKETTAERIKRLLLRTNRKGIDLLKYRTARLLIKNSLTDIGNLHREIIVLCADIKQTVCEAVQNALECHRAKLSKKDCDSFSCSFCSQTFESLSLRIQHRNYCLNDIEVGNSSKLFDNTSPESYTKKVPEPISVMSVKTFACSICEKKFGTQFGLIVHQQQHSSLEQSCHCAVCHQVFNNTNSMGAHYLQIHSFDVQIDSDEAIDEELERAIYELDFLDLKCCKSCSQPLATQALYGSHVICEHGDNIELMNNCAFICSQCNEPFALRVSLESHWTNFCRQIWKGSEISDSVNVCEVCGLKFMNDKNLYTHNGIFHMEKKFTCDECGNSYVDETRLKAHNNSVHQKESLFCCELCGKRFKQNNKLEKHKKIVHSQVKSFGCHICSKPFVSRATLEDHLRIHTGEKPYKCSFCNKSYASLASKSVHELSHKGYKCKICAKTFEGYAELCAHRKLHRDEALVTSNEENEKTNGKLHVCNICGKTFQKYITMYQHARNSHGEEIFSCDICDKKYKNSAALKSHKYTHNTWKAFGCSVCGKTFRQRGTFYLHRKTRHRNSGAEVVILTNEGSQENSVVGSDMNVSKPITPEAADTPLPSKLQLVKKNFSEVPENPILDESRNTIAVEWQVSPEHDYSAPTDIEFVVGEIPQFENNQQIGTGFVITSIEFSDTDVGSAAYIDFSRANVPLDSTQLQTFEKQNSDETGDALPIIPIENNLNLEKTIENQEADDTNSTVATNTFDVPIIKVEVKPNQLPSDSLHETTGFNMDDDCMNDFDILENPENCMKTRRFPLDPFSPQLIVKLAKLKVYNCVPCSLTFHSVKEYRSHLRRRTHIIAVEDTTYTPSSFICNYCGKVFLTKEELREHDKLTNIKCKYCKKERIYKSEKLLFRHYRSTHREDKVFECEMCPERFETLSLFKRHKVEDHLNKTENSKPSNVNPIPEETLTKFKSTETDVRVRFANIYTCPICFQQFPGWDKYRHHTRTHKPDQRKNFPCQHCDAKFISSVKLLMHCSTKHPGEKVFQCELCLELFDTVRNRRRHTDKVHLGKPPERKKRKERDPNSKKDVVCELCGKTFYSESDVKVHFRDTHQERKHACDLCTKIFRRTKDLNRHKIRHTGKRAFLCSECGKAFFSAGELKCHVDRVHRGIQRLQDYKPRKCREIKFFCPYCPAKFAKESGINLHMGLHDETRPYACDLCGLRYKFANNVTTHKNYVHKKEKEKLTLEVLETYQES